MAEPKGGYFRGNRSHPRNIQVEVRPHHHFRPADSLDGSNGPGTRLFVSRVELDVARHLLIEVDSPEFKAASA